MEAKDTKTIQRLKAFRLQSKVTGKRQITIPKEIYDYYQLKNGDLISFIEQDGHIVFEPTYYNVVCFICNGTTKIGDNECFVCRGEGHIDKDIARDVMRLIGYMVLNAFSYKVTVSYETNSIVHNGKERYLAYPIITFKSKEYDQEKLRLVRDIIQSRIIKQTMKSHFTYGMDKELVIQDIKASLFIKEVREEVVLWFIEECINKHHSDGKD